MTLKLNELISAYIEIKQRVLDAGFAAEIDWQEHQQIDSIVEPQLLREVGWVILSSGMRETVIRGIFPRFSLAFLDWRSAKDVWSRRKECAERGLAVFNHEAKVGAILQFAEYLARHGFSFTIDQIKEQGCEFLQRFTYLGPATSLHLAKNLGLDVVKPDRHLCRIAHALGADSPKTLCEVIAANVGDRLNVVDIVLWRFATIQRNYLEAFALQNS